MYIQNLSTNGTNSFLFVTFVVDISFDVFKTEASAGPEAVKVAIKRPFFHLDLGPMPRNLAP